MPPPWPAQGVAHSCGMHEPHSPSSFDQALHTRAPVGQLCLEPLLLPKYLSDEAKYGQ